MGGTARLALAITALLVGMGSARAEQIPGKDGATTGPGWAAAWRDLTPSVVFKAGDRLCIRITGSESVLIRLLPVGTDPNQPVGVVGGIRNVPSSGAVDVTLASDHGLTSQISVHGGPTAWHWQFPAGNGAPHIVSVERLEANESCR